VFLGYWNLELRSGSYWRELSWCIILGSGHFEDRNEKISYR